MSVPVESEQIAQPSQPAAEVKQDEYQHYIGTTAKAACFKCRDKVAKEFVIEEVKPHKRQQTKTVRGIGKCKVCGTPMSTFVGSKKKE